MYRIIEKCRPHPYISLIVERAGDILFCPDGRPTLSVLLWEAKARSVISESDLRAMAPIFKLDRSVADNKMPPGSFSCSLGASSRGLSPGSRLLQ